MQAQMGACLDRDTAQWYSRCDPYYQDLARLSGQRQPEREVVA